MRLWHLVIDDTGSLEGVCAFIYWGVTDPLLTHSQTLKDRATQLLIKYKSGALVTQCHLLFIQSGSDHQIFPRKVGPKVLVRLATQNTSSLTLFIFLNNFAI